MSRRVLLAAFLIIALTAAIEHGMGRSLLCTCGTIDLWIGSRDSPKTSQMLVDWYSFSHIVHGMLFYSALWLVARRSPVEWRFLASFAIEAAWEVIENSPIVVDRYRTTTAALGYTGDSILNSMSDISMMAIGFLLARKLPVIISFGLLILLELVPLFVIRDNLTLNVWNLIAPSKAVQAWQSKGQRHISLSQPL